MTSAKMLSAVGSVMNGPRLHPLGDLKGALRPPKLFETLIGFLGASQRVAYQAAPILTFTNRLGALTLFVLLDAEPN